MHNTCINRASEAPLVSEAAAEAGAREASILVRSEYDGLRRGGGRMGTAFLVGQDSGGSGWMSGKEEKWASQSDGGPGEY